MQPLCFHIDLFVQPHSVSTQQMGKIQEDKKVEAADRDV